TKACWQPESGALHPDSKKSRMRSTAATERPRQRLAMPATLPGASTSKLAANGASKLRATSPSAQSFLHDVQQLLDLGLRVIHVGSDAQRTSAHADEDMTLLQALHQVRRHLSSGAQAQIVWSAELLRPRS